MQETTIKSSCLTRMMASGQKIRHLQKQIKWVPRHSLIYATWAKLHFDLRKNKYYKYEKNEQE